MLQGGGGGLELYKFCDVNFEYRKYFVKVDIQFFFYFKGLLGLFLLFFELFLQFYNGCECVCVVSNVL